MKKQKILKIAMRLFFAIVFVLILIVAGLNQKDIVCKEVQVNIIDKNELKFVSENEILSIIQNNSLVNQKISEIDLENIEKILEENEFIDNAEVFSNFDGLINIDIVQNKPLYRIINNSNVSYYISNKSYKVPLSSNFTPRLILATGHIPNKEVKPTNLVNYQLDKLIKYIKSDAFWDAMITQVEVKPNGEFVLIPKLGKHTVLLGDAERLEEKFSKLKIFYQKAIKKTNWEEYKEINLKYEGQLIGSK